MSIRKKYTQTIVIRVQPEIAEAIETVTNKGNRSKSEVLRDIIERGMSANIIEDNKQVIREVVREEITRTLNPAVNRLANLISKTFLQSATANVLNQEVLAQLFNDSDLTDEENLSVIKEMIDDAQTNAIKLLIQKNGK